MRKRARAPFLWFFGAAFTAATVAAHVRLIYPANGATLYWATPTGIPVVIQSDGSSDINDGSEATAVRNAMAAWNTAGASTLVLAEDTNPLNQVRTDWASVDTHLVLFDEDNSSGFFPGSSGIVAITPVTFFTNGRIIDADVLFNGKNFSFTTEGQLGRFDVQDIATHELGHLIGLDHSGCAGATMYPYVDSTVILHRSLSLDDARGVRTMYPNAVFGQVMGTLARAGGGAVRGAHVVARDANGRLAGATLSNEAGAFLLTALDTGTYTLYADPLDFPVSSSNLGGQQVVDTDFGTTMLGPVAVTAGQTANLGAVTVAGDVAVSLGRVADDYPLRAIIGATNTHLVRGSGLVAGSSLTVSDPSLTITPLAWFGTSVQFQVTAPPGSALGHVDLEVTTLTGDLDVLTGALELTPPNPVVASVVPGVGAPAGGTALTVTGSGFRPGARVVAGGRIYVDGEPGGATVVDGGTITLTTAATLAGSHDVVVIDESGVEGRADDALVVAAAPTVASVFPAVGAAAGGTQVVVTGTDFVAGTLVTIDGVVQPNVTIDSPQQLSLVTAAGVVGGPYVLEVTSPGGLTASAAFSYVAQADPELHDVSPGSGPATGGHSVTVVGAGFTATTTVFFGAHSKTGQGGVPAAAVQLVDATTLLVTTPATNNTVGTVMVRDSVTAQASLVSGAYAFESEPELEEWGGFGGCGSLATPPPGPPSLRAVASGAGWIALALLAALWRARSRAGAVALAR